jgi:hypothetical protein
LFLKKDNLQLGIALALVLPVLVFIGIYLLRFSFYSLPDFLGQVREQDNLITFFGTWCTVANIALFTIYINTDRFQTSKGIFIVTLLYGVLILLLKVLN